MKNLKNKTIIITGAASGIGRSISLRCVKEDMNIVLADIEKEKLKKTYLEIEEKGASVIEVITDVSKYQDVKNLASHTLDKFGHIDIVINNAGVGVSGPIWTRSMKDWNWVIGVNLYGVIHSVKVFIPIMLEQKSDCYFINTSSGYGLIPEGGIYGVSKHAITALSEILAMELAGINSDIKIGVLIPGITKTNILNSERNRPIELRNQKLNIDNKSSGFMERREKYVRSLHANGMNPDEIAQALISGIKEGKFYIIHDPYLKRYVKKKYDFLLKSF